MNSANRVTIAGALDADALRILARFPAIVATASAPPGTPPGAAVVGVEGVVHPVRIEVLAAVTVTSARDLVRWAQASPRPAWFVIADRVTEEARTILRESGIGFASAAGHLHLTMPGLLVHVDVSGHLSGGAAPLDAAGLSDAAERAVHALLLDPRQAWRVRELARRARVSVGLSHRVLIRLEAEGIVLGEGDRTGRRRHVVDVGRLLDGWIDETDDRGLEVVTASRPASSPHELARAMASAFGAAGILYAVTGATAAAIMAPGVGPVATVDAWVGSAIRLDAALAVIGAQRTTGRGNLVLTQVPGDRPLAFAENRDGIVCVDPVRLYYDLAHAPRPDGVLTTLLRQAIVRR